MGIYDILFMHVYGRFCHSQTAAHTQRVREHYQISLLKSLERNTAFCFVFLWASEIIAETKNKKQQQKRPATLANRVITYLM